MTRASQFAPIVAVDDDRAALKLVARFLAKIQVRNEVLTARSGREAISLYESLIDQGRIPALMLLDVKMPDGSGLEVLRWIAKHPALAGVPVVMLTGTAESDEVNEAYDLGAVSYLVKPVGFEALADVVRGLMTPWALLPPERDG